MSADVIKAEKCHWQKKNAKGECEGFYTGLRIRVAPYDGQEIIVVPDGDGWDVVEVTNPNAFHFVETPVVEVELPRSLQWGISRFLEAKEQFANDYGGLLQELLATPLYATKQTSGEM